MNAGSIHGSPSAEHPIASQKLPSGAAAKAADAKLHKRPEDEVPADPTVVAAADEQTLVAQAAPAPAADGAASAAPAPAAEGSTGGAAAGSAGAGASIPAAAAAAGGFGLPLGAIALGGAGAAGLAVAASGGGGGGGGGGTTAAASVPTQIHNFSEYTAAINAGGATAATHATGTTRPDQTVSVDISGGMSRSALPKALGDLRPMTYNVSGADAATINDGGVIVDVQGNSDARVTAHSDAGAGASNLMWMQNLAVRDSAGQGETVARASATASGAGADAEIGIQHLSMALKGTGAVNGRTDLIATASGGGSAHTLASDVNLSVDSSAVGPDANGNDVSAQIHLGFGDGWEPGMLASASGIGSSATVGTGNVSLSAHGDSAYAFSSGVFAQGTDGGSAHVDTGNLSFAADGRAAHSYILVDASTDATGGSAGDVHIHGNVDLQSTGSESALTRAGVRADGNGTVEIDGHLNVHSDGALADSMVQVIAQGGDGHANIGSIGMNVEGGSHAWMDLYTDHAGGLNIGAVNLSVTAESDITLHVQNANDALTGGQVNDTFLAHGDSTAPVSIGTANVGGEGEVHMHLNTQTFGTINQAASVERMDLNYHLADQDSGSAPMTTINGFTGHSTDVIYNGVLADDTNFANAGDFTSLAAMNAGIDAALDGTHKYVFAVYNGTEDINGNGVADDHGSGVLAFDDNGAGVTSVLMLPGVTTLTPTDLA